MVYNYRRGLVISNQDLQVVSPLGPLLELALASVLGSLLQGWDSCRASATRRSFFSSGFYCHQRPGGPTVSCLSSGAVFA